jgi:hypothetical protein
MNKKSDVTVHTMIVLLMTCFCMSYFSINGTETDAVQIAIQQVSDIKKSFFTGTNWNIILDYKTCTNLLSDVNTSDDLTFIHIKEMCEMFGFEKYGLELMHTLTKKYFSNDSDAIYSHLENFFEKAYFYCYILETLKGMQEYTAYAQALKNMELAQNMQLAQYAKELGFSFASEQYVQYAEPVGLLSSVNDRAQQICIQISTTASYHKQLRHSLNTISILYGRMEVLKNKGYSAPCNDLFAINKEIFALINNENNSAIIMFFQKTFEQGTKKHRWSQQSITITFEHVKDIIEFLSSNQAQQYTVEKNVFYRDEIKKLLIGLISIFTKQDGCNDAQYVRELRICADNNIIPQRKFETMLKLTEENDKKRIKKIAELKKELIACKNRLMEKDQQYEARIVAISKIANPQNTLNPDKEKIKAIEENNNQLYQYWAFGSTLGFAIMFFLYITK